MVREPSRNTAFTSPQGWVGEIVSQVRTGGFLTFEYHMWRDQKSKDNGEPPFLLNNHKAQIRETHQRIRVNGEGKFLHRGDGVTPVALPADDIDTFLFSDSRAYIWKNDRKRLDKWVDTKDRSLSQFVFQTYSGADEALDPQWVRDTFVIDQHEQVLAAILSFLGRAEQNAWVGDRRGTTLNLQVGASADDAFQLTDTTVNIVAASVLSDDENEWFGWRWQNVTVDNAATINTAVLSVMPTSSTTDEPLHDFACQDADNPGEFTTASNNISGRTRTSSPTSWSSTNLGADGATFFSPPDLSTHVQAVVNRGGWSSGNAIVMTCHQPSTDSTRDLGVLMYDSSSAVAAKLDIDYTAGGGGDPEGSLIRGKLIRGGILRGGVLVG